MLPCSFRRSSPWAILSFAAFLAMLPAAAAEPTKRILFDGKTLDGWQPTKFFHAGEVKVEDCAILLKNGGSMTGITTTRQDLPTSNYELIYEARRLEGEDFFAAATFPVGKSFLTFVNGGWGGTITGLSSINGADASENETGKFFKYIDKTWYKFRIQVSDDAIRCWIDETKVVNLEHRDRHLGTRIETRPNQPFGFATYESTGALRKIEIRALNEAEIAAMKPAE